MDSKRLVIPLILFPLLFSGCVLPTQQPFESNTPVGTGVVVEHFGPDYTEVYSGEEVKFTLRVKNTGSIKAEYGFAELLGLDQVWIPGHGTMTTTDGEVLPDEIKCRFSNKGLTLLPEDTDSGISGGIETCNWRYIAPQVSPGLNIQSKARVRFYYSYKSSTIKTVTLASKEEIKALQDQGKGLPSETYSKTKSPISIDIETASPIRTYADRVEFPIIITVKNVGGGTVCRSIEGCKKNMMGAGAEWYMTEMEIKTPPDMQLSVCRSPENIMLIGDKPQTISCKVVANTGSIVGVAQRNLEVKSTYGYFIDKTADVVVYPSARPQE